jgi:hypothetical protein
MFDIGQLAPNTKCRIEARVDCHVEKREHPHNDNLYVVETVVCCFNNESGFRVLVGLETVLLADGTLEDITETIKASIREDIFAKAEKAILDITSIHGCPLRIYLNKYIERYGDDSEAE